MPAHDCAHRDQTRLAPTRPEDRKCVVFAPEQPVSGGPHQEQVLGVGVQPAQDAQHALDEQRALHQPLVDKVLQVVQVPHVIAFKLEPRALRIAQAREDRFDVGEGVAEDLALGPSDVACLPGVFPVTDPAPGLVEGKVHRPHVQRTQLWPRLQRIGQPVVQRHRHASVRGDVDDRVGGHGDAGARTGRTPPDRASGDRPPGRGRADAGPPPLPVPPRSPDRRSGPASVPDAATSTGCAPIR